MEGDGKTDAETGAPKNWTPDRPLVSLETGRFANWQTSSGATKAPDNQLSHITVLYYSYVACASVRWCCIRLTMTEKQSTGARTSGTAKPKATARLQMRHQHVRLLFKVWEKFPPLGEAAKDRKMKAGGSDVAVWEPMVAEYNRRLPEVNKEILKKNPADSGKLITSVHVKMLQDKWRKLKKEYHEAQTCDPVN